MGYVCTAVSVRDVCVAEAGPIAHGPTSRLCSGLRGGMISSQEFLSGIGVCCKLVPGTFMFRLRLLVVLHICAVASLCKLHGWRRLGYRKIS